VVSALGGGAMKFRSMMPCLGIFEASQEGAYPKKIAINAANIAHKSSSI
jgi:hypothetical protein